MCGGGEPFSVIKPPAGAGSRAACVLGNSERTAGTGAGGGGGEMRVMERCVNKVDCLIGCRVMNCVVIHSLKGHTVFLLTCGQP